MDRRQDWKTVWKRQNRRILSNVQTEQENLERNADNVERTDKSAERKDGTVEAKSQNEDGQMQLNFSAFPNRALTQNVPAYTE
jgi:hypothetical protein